MIVFNWSVIKSFIDGLIVVLCDYVSICFQHLHNNLENYFCSKIVNVFLNIFAAQKAETDPNLLTISSLVEEESQTGTLDISC